MGAEFKDAKLAGSAQARAQALEGIRRRREAVARRGEPGGAPREQQTEEASMFPGEAPGRAIPVTPPPGFEEAQFRRNELTRERTRTGRREEVFNDFRRAAAERDAIRGSSFGGNESSPFGGGRPPGPGGGMVFGPGRATRMPEPGSPDYQALMNRMRAAGMRR
jgi:hypothetical protein